MESTTIGCCDECGDRPSPLPPELLEPHVEKWLRQGKEFLDLVGHHGSPLYVLDPATLRSKARTFLTAFSGRFRNLGVYYALKSNSLPEIARILLQEGIGLDVSSGDELCLALELNASDVYFSGPGKTDKELRLALEHADRVTILLDSPGEMLRLESLGRLVDRKIRVGVRVAGSHCGLWRKFGIPQSRLPGTLERLMQCRHLQFRGIQFHLSWNRTPQAQAEFLRQLGRIWGELPAEACDAIEFLDLGGGYWPPEGEWLRRSDPPTEDLRDARPSGSQLPEAHYRLPASPIECFAEELHRAVRAHLPLDRDCRICTEPGRWLCSDAMHLLMTVVDRKSDDLVITDAGTNAIGWEQFETGYAPIINLTRPARTEKKCDVLGSLCTPHDVWGAAYHGSDIHVGDTLLIPCQGAYTYSLRQRFIKPLPKVCSLSDDS